MSTMASLHTPPRFRQRWPRHIRLEAGEPSRANPPFCQRLSKNYFHYSRPDPFTQTPATANTNFYVRCPNMSVSAAGCYANNLSFKYGSSWRYCYDCPPGGWYYGEVVTGGGTCPGAAGNIVQTPGPVILSGGCWTDDQLFDGSGANPGITAEELVTQCNCGGSCTMTRTQTIYVGPSSNLQLCSYANNITITLTDINGVSGTVSTSMSGHANNCGTVPGPI